MRHSWQISRIVWASASFATLAMACDAVLDIEDPKRRPGDLGASGASDDVAGTAGSTGGVDDTPQGGTGRELGGEGSMIAGGGNAGQGGGGASAECEENALRCGGNSEKTPEICRDGHWTFNDLEADADCPVQCAAGKCLECMPTDKRCSVCEDGDASCDRNRPQRCVDGHWRNDADACSQFCAAGDCQTTPSCDAKDEARTTCMGDESCCRSLVVPGGSFKRDFDGVDFPDDSHPAEVSAFRLDKFEVTVGRMRQFVAAFQELKLKLEDGDGKSAHIADDPGWDTDSALPADQAALLTELKCAGTTWSDDLLENNDLPVNCVSYNVAYAFCIWDGGRLPSNLEWNFAASGGDEQRVYPWKSPESATSISADYANYDNANPGPLAAGSKPMGNGRWGQADLAGNLLEWALDYYIAPTDYPATCRDCLNETPGVERVLRGGSYNQDASLQVSSFPTSNDPTALRSYIGFRCARDLE